MVEKHRENPGDSAFQIRFIEREGGYFFELEQPDRPATVALCSGPYKGVIEAQEAGAIIVRDLLRARIQAAEIARCGERPSHHLTWHALCREVVPEWRATVYCDRFKGHEGPHQAITWHPGEPLEGEQLCVCSHGDGLHGLGANECHAHGCPCRDFEPIAQVDAEVRS